MSLLHSLRTQKTYILYVLVVAGIWVFGGCASHKKNFFSKTYHNTTARYNAYFLAKEKIREVEEAMASSHKDNYDKILPIFYDIDSSVISSEREKLNDVIVKGSLPITRHENSKWVYPSYYLIGKARYYTADFPNAIETFRYINVNAEDDDIRQKALISLMRTYIDYDELNNAVGVADYIRKEKLTKENELEFLLTKAYFFSIRKDYNNMVKNLSQAMEFEPKRKYQARYYFTLGQVYQLNGFEGEAYNNFKKCLKEQSVIRAFIPCEIKPGSGYAIGSESQLKEDTEVFHQAVERR